MKKKFEELISKTLSESPKNLESKIETLMTENKVFQHRSIIRQLPDVSGAYDVDLYYKMKEEDEFTLLAATIIPTKLKE